MMEDAAAPIYMSKEGFVASTVANATCSVTILKTNLNALFLVIMGAIIIFMQAGFGFLEAGSIRAKNATNILIKNFADLIFGNNIYNERLFFHDYKLK